MKKIIKIAISILLLCISLYFLDWATLATVFRTLNPWMLLVASFVCLLTYVIIAIRWYMLARNVVNLSFWAQMKIYLYSNFLNTFTPANIGGDIYRLISLKKYTDSNLSILFCLIKERILGLLSYLLLYLFF
nr:flippase-like domain-containing protein [Desulfobacula sp.]